jgi:predicted ATPase
MEGKAGRPGRLPAFGTAFVGRAGERARVEAALREARLVTLVAPAGMGATRLAAEVAASAGPPGAFVELTPVGSAHLTQAVATAVGVTERPGQPLADSLAERLRQGPFLLVLDAGRHAVPAGVVAGLLAAAPDLVILATSRVPLGLPCERVIPVRPLPTQGEGDQPAEAVALFISRSGTPGEADPELVAGLCARLGGNPLAIELIAARLDPAGPAGPHADLLTRLAGDRPQDVLRAVIGWSYQLLDGAARRLLRQLSVFVAGVDIEAVCRLGTGGDRGAARALAGRLTAAGLLRAQGGGRWRMPEAVRQYALDRLAVAGEEPECRARYLSWAVATAGELERMTDANRSWRDRFDLVADDLRAALPGSPSPEPAAHRLARSLAHLCYARQFLAESRERYRMAAGYAPDDMTAATDLRAAADVSMAEHRGEPAMELLSGAARRSRAAGDRAGEAIALASAVCAGARFPATFSHEVPYGTLCQLLEQARRAVPADHPLAAAQLAAAEAWNATGRKTMPDPELSRNALQDARAADDPVLIIAAIDALTSAAGGNGRFREAQQLSSERIRQFGRLRRDDPRSGVEIIDTLHVTPMVAVAAGDLAAAVAAARRAWTDPFSGLYMRASKHVIPLALAGQFDEALGFAVTMWGAWEQVGRPAARWMAPAVHAAALIHGLRGDLPAHREWVIRACQLAEPRQQGHISDSFAAFADTRVAIHLGAFDEALAAAVDLTRLPPWAAATHQFYDPYSWVVAAEAAVAAGLPDAPDRLALAEPVGAECAWAAACLSRARGRLHGDRAALEESAAGWERIGARFERAVTLLLLPDLADEGRAELAALGCPAPDDAGRRAG